MKMLLVQKYLLTHTFGELEKDHGVSISVDSRFGHKFSLNYDQIASRTSDPLASQCRGLILTNGSSLWERATTLNKKRDYSSICPGSTWIVAYPFDRFLNYKQTNCSDLDWSDPDLKVLEKLDGTFCILYFDHIINEWHVATRSVPEADIKLDSWEELTFRKLFEMALENVGSISFKDFTKELNPNFTYCYELTSPYNQVVVQYDRPKLHLLGIRDKYTKEEVLPEKCLGSNSYVPIVNSFPLNNIEEVLSYVSNCNPIKQEGVVIRDSRFRRVKVKNASYVLLSHTTDQLKKSPRAFMQLILSGKEDDILPHIPDIMKKKVASLKAGLLKFTKKFDSDFQVLHTKYLEQRSSLTSTAEDRKLFALCVQESGIWATPCYEIFAGKASNIMDFLQKHEENNEWPVKLLDYLLSVIEC